MPYSEFAKWQKMADISHIIIVINRELNFAQWKITDLSMEYYRQHELTPMPLKYFCKFNHMNDMQKA